VSSGCTFCSLSSPSPLLSLFLFFPSSHSCECGECLRALMKQAGFYKRGIFPPSRRAPFFLSFFFSFSPPFLPLLDVFSRFLVHLGYEEVYAKTDVLLVILLLSSFSPFFFSFFPPSLSPLPPQKCCTSNRRCRPQVIVGNVDYAVCGCNPSFFFFFFSLSLSPPPPFSDDGHKSASRHHESKQTEHSKRVLRGTRCFFSPFFSLFFPPPFPLAVRNRTCWRSRTERRKSTTRSFLPPPFSPSSLSRLEFHKTFFRADVISHKISQDRFLLHFFPSLFSFSFFFFFPPLSLPAVEHVGRRP